MSLYSLLKGIYIATIEMIEKQMKIELDISRQTVGKLEE